MQHQQYDGIFHHISPGENEQLVFITLMVKAIIDVLIGIDSPATDGENYWISLSNRASYDSSTLATLITPLGTDWSHSRRRLSLAVEVLAHVSVGLKWTSDVLSPL